VAAAAPAGLASSRAGGIDPKPVRRLTARGAVQASAVFDADDHVFIVDMAGWIQAFTLTGVRLWQHQTGWRGVRHAAVDIGAGRVYVGHSDGVGVRSGDWRWQRALAQKHPDHERRADRVGTCCSSRRTSGSC